MNSLADISVHTGIYGISFSGDEVCINEKVVSFLSSLTASVCYLPQFHLLPSFQIPPNHYKTFGKVLLLKNIPGMHDIVLPDRH